MLIRRIFNQSLPDVSETSTVSCKRCYEITPCRCQEGSHLTGLFRIDLGGPTLTQKSRICNLRLMLKLQQFLREDRMRFMI